MLISYLPLGARALLGLILAVSIVHKVRGRRAFAQFAGSLGDLRLVPKRATSALAAIAVGVETAICAALAHPAAYRIGLLAAALLMVAYSTAIGVVLRRGVHAPCACFGSHNDRPLSRLQMARNLVLAAAAIAGAVAASAAAAADVRPAGAAVTIFAAALLTVVVVYVDDIVDLFAPWSGTARSGPLSTNR